MRNPEAPREGMVGRSLIVRLLGVAATAAIALALPAASSAEAATPAPPTLKLERYCGYFADRYSGVEVTATVDPPVLPPPGEAPYDPESVPRIEGVSSAPGPQALGEPGAVGGELTLGDTAPRTVFIFTDASGFARNAFGADNPSRYTVTVYWAGGTLTRSLAVDCRKPTAKRQCKNGGWRRMGFASRKRCFAYARRH